MLEFHCLLQANGDNLLEMNDIDAVLWEIGTLENLHIWSLLFKTSHNHINEKRVNSLTKTSYSAFS